MAEQTITLAEFVADPTRAGDIPPKQVPAFMAGLLHAHATLLATMLSAEPGRPAVSSDPDEFVDVDKAAEIINRSPSWLRKHGHSIPGFHQPGGRGTRARWSRAALLKWARPNLADPSSMV